MDKYVYNFHELTTQVPHTVQIAVPRGTRKPKLLQPPIATFGFTPRVFRAGIEHRVVDGIALKMYGPEKAIADAFRYRNKIGADLAVEALRTCARRKNWRLDDLLKYARICRVETILRPYLQAIT